MIAFKLRTETIDYVDVLQSGERDFAIQWSWFLLNEHHEKEMLSV